MPRHDDHFHPEPALPVRPQPQAGVAGHTAMRADHPEAGPDRDPGEAAIERRQAAGSRYTGPERRLARR